MSETLSERIDPATLWRGDQWGSSTAAVTVDLEPDLLAPLLARARGHASAGTDASTLTADDVPLGPLEATIDRIADEVVEGRGLVLVSGIPVFELTVDEAAIVWWAIGLHLGTPVSQSVMGDRIGHVVDVSGKDPHARAYRNASELTPHTDPADILAFLCLRPAKTGGTSRFTSAMTVHEELRRRRPDLLAPLYRGFRYHRFGEQAADSEPITPHLLPVFSECDGRVSCRYVRQYIEIAASERDDIELTATDREALDVFEAIAAEPGVGLEFTLDSGEGVIANNFTVLHARTAFEDHADPGRKRHLLRLWIAAHHPRPLRPEVALYDGEPGIAPQPGRTPSYRHDVEIV